MISSEHDMNHAALAMGAFAVAAVVLGAAVLAALLVGRARKSGTHFGDTGTQTETNPDYDSWPARDAPEIQAELASLRGKWIGVAFRVDGLDRPVAAWYRYSFDGDRMTTEMSDADPGTVKFYLNPNTDPKRLDTSILVDGVEEVSKGIYSIDGDTLRFSWRVVGECPKDFRSRDRDEKIVLVLRRANE